jgi:ADP-heptose:LPS heptosyltransferase
LQKGPGEEEETTCLPSNQSLIVLGDKIEDFSDSAAIISQLDLVICVDTAILHVAGALNIPCWVLLSYYGTDWRWPNKESGEPWYSNKMRLFRQAEDCSWDNVIEQVKQALITLKDSTQILKP